MWKFYFISLFSLFAQTQSLYQISTARLEENKSFQGLLTSKIIFQSNQKQFQFIEIDFQIIKEVFTIEQFKQGKIINLVFLNTLNFQNQIVFCICQLLQETSYFIVCIDGIQSFKNEVEFKLIKNAKKYYIDLQTEIQEICETLVIDSENQLIVYCYTLTKLKIHKINLKSQTTILLKQFEQINTIDCKYKFINFDQMIILAFYNCQEWKLMKITEDKLENILDQQLLKETLEINSLQISKLTEIFNCQDYFYLIEYENYLVLKFIETKFQFYEQNNGNYEIFSIQYSFICQVNYMIVLDNQYTTSRINFDQTKRQVIISKQYQYDIYGLDQFILLRNKNYLNVILCQFLNQTIEIQSSKLYFMDNYIKFKNIDFQFPQLFYQIEQSSQKAYFYQYFKLPKIIKPTKKYLYSLEYFDIFTKYDYENILIQEVIYQNDQFTKIDSYKTTAVNDCKNSISVYLKKNLLELPQNYEIVFQKQQSESILNILDETDYYQLLPHMKGKNIQTIHNIGNLEKTGVNSIIYIYQDNLYFYNILQSKIVYQRYINKLMILHAFGFIVAINFQINNMFILVPGNYKIEVTEYFNKSISKVTQSNNYLIIQFNDQSFLIYNFPIMRYEYLQNNIIELGIPIYYSSNAAIQIIQYENYVLFKIRKYQKIVELENIIIFQTFQSNQEIFIKSIHKIEDKLIIFYFDGSQLIVIDELIVYDNKFLRPLQFQQDNDFVSIASITNQNKSICTFLVKDFIKLINVKLCHNHNFTLSSDFLIYFNLNNQLKLYNLNFLNITLKSPEQQITYYDQHQIQLQIKYEHNNSLFQLQTTLQILVFNFCYQIYPIQKSIKIIDINKVQLETLFQGPITEIVLKYESVQTILSPFQKQQQILSCSNFSTQNCFTNYQILQQSTEDYFQFQYASEFRLYYVQENFELKSKYLQHCLINNSTLLLNFLEFEDKIYLHYFKIEHEKRQLTEIKLEILHHINISLLELEVKFRDPLVLIKIIEKVKKTDILILFQQQNYIIYPVEKDREIIDIFKISNDKYLKQLHFKNQEHFELYSIVNFKLVMKFNFSLLNSDFENILEQIIDYHKDIYQFKKIILNSTLFDNILVINLFLIFHQFSSEVEIIYNIQKEQKQFKLLKIIRNPYQSISTDLYYQDSQFLILQSMKTFNYLYDLRRNQSLFDHFAQLEFNTNFFQFNTTHYIIARQNEYFVGKIGFDLQFLENKKNSVEQLLIIAKNQVSSAELEIEILETIQRDLFSIYLLFILMLVLFILICFIRRKYLKLKFQGRQQIQSQF